MEPNLDLLPKDMSRQILYKMKVDDVLNYCKHSQKGYKLCNEDGFWGNYIDNNHDMKLLQEAIEPDIDHPIDIGSLHEILINRASTVEEGEFDVGPAIALYLEDSKILKYILRVRARPSQVKTILISPYDYLFGCITEDNEGESWLCSDDVIIYRTNNQLKIESLKNQIITAEIADKPMEDLKIKDITINGFPLLETVTTWEFNIKF